jgi:hypothetical protein
LSPFNGGGFPSLSASRSGPSELSYVPADSAVVAFANVREVMDSQLRQRIKQAFPDERGQKEFQERTGIDIERDIDYIVAAMTTPGAGGLKTNPNGLVVARGPLQRHAARDPRARAWRRRRGIQGKRLVKASERQRHRHLASRSRSSSPASSASAAKRPSRAPSTRSSRATASPATTR